MIGFGAQLRTALVPRRSAENFDVGGLKTKENAGLS